MPTPKQIPLPGAPEYQPYEVPETVEAPQNTAPPPVQIQDTSLPAPKYGFGRGASGALGTAAFLASNVLRGYAQGKAISQARQAMNAKRVADGLHSVYEMAAKNYYQLYESRIDAGKKPTDPDFMTQDLQMAKDRVDVSWAAMMKYVSGQVMGPAGQKKKGKGKGKDQSGQADQTDPSVNPIAGLQSQDPVDRAKAWLAMATKIGPDVYIQTRALSSRQGIAEVSYGAQHAENRAQREKDEQRLDELLRKPNPTEEDAAEINRLRSVRASTTSAKTPKIDPQSVSTFTLDKDSMASPSIQQFTRDGVVYDSNGVPLRDGTHVSLATRADGTPVLFSKEGMEKILSSVDTGTGEPVYARATPSGAVPIAPRAVPTTTERQVPGVDINTGEPSPVTLETTRRYGRPQGETPTAGTPPPSTETIPTPISSGATDHPQGPPSTQNAIVLASRGYPVIGGKEPAGLSAPGTIDLNNRPVLGSYSGTQDKPGVESSELSFSREQDGREVLVPQIVNGKKLSQDEAWQHYLQTGEHLGKFDTAEHADAYAEQIHNRPTKPKPPAGTPAAAAGPSTAQQTGRQKATATPPAPTTHTPEKKVVIPTSQYNQFNKQATPTRNAGTQILGDPHFPELPTLVTVAPLYDDPKARERIGTALSLILDDLDKTEQATGAITQALRGGFDLDVEAKRAYTKETDQYLNSLSKQEQEAVDLTISAAGAVIGMRASTGASAAKFSAALIERELPIPGRTVTSSHDAYLKLAKLAQEVANTSSANPLMKNWGYAEYYTQKVTELENLAHAPAGASAGVYAPDGKTLIGHIVNNKYVPLEKKSEQK